MNHLISQIHRWIDHVYSINNHKDTYRRYRFLMNKYDFVPNHKIMHHMRSDTYEHYKQYKWKLNPLIFYLVQLLVIKIK